MVHSRSHPHEHILREVSFVLERPYFRRRLTPAEQIAAIDLLRSRALVIPLATVEPGVAPHRHDDPVLITAASGSQFLVSGDRQLLDMREFRGVPIVTPRQFMAILDDAPTVR